MWADAQRDGRRAEYRWRSLRDLPTVNYLGQMSYCCPHTHRHTHTRPIALPGLRFCYTLVTS